MAQTSVLRPFRATRLPVGGSPLYGTEIPVGEVLTNLRFDVDRDPATGQECVTFGIASEPAAEFATLREYYYFGTTLRWHTMDTPDARRAAEAAAAYDALHGAPPD